MSMERVKVQFTKMTGAGNDFILVDNRTGHYKLQWENFARSVCDRRYGIGGDGLLVLEKNTTSDFTMLYFNADGTWGGMCGNGGRCAAAFVMRGQELSNISFECLGY